MIIMALPGCQLSVCSLLSLQTFAGLAGVCFNIYFDKTISVDDRLSLLCLNSLNCRDKSSSRTWKRVGATLYLSLFVATNCQSGNYKIAFNWTARRIVKVFDGNIFFQKLKHWIIFFGLYTFINKVTSGKFSPIRMSLSFFLTIQPTEIKRAGTELGGISVNIFSVISSRNLPALPS